LKKLIARGVGYLSILIVIAFCIFLSRGIILVKEGQMAVLIKKTGKDLTNYNSSTNSYNYLLSCPIISPGPEYKGIQEKALPEGWHFYNPYVWDYKIMSQTHISKGEVGIKVRLFGKPLDQKKQQILAGPGQIGIVKKILKAGQHFINPYAYKIIIKKAVNIRQGYRGVVTNLAGKISESKKFGIGDIKEPGKLALKILNAQDPVSQYLSSKFSPTMQNLLRKYKSLAPAFPDKKFRKEMALELNKILVDKHLYSSDRFRNVSLLETTRQILKKFQVVKLEKDSLMKLNRHLLADAYSDEIERSSFLVAPGERGVCEETLIPRRCYFNPYEKSVTPVDIRSHRFDLSGRNRINFPSFDGFPITMEGNIEWRIHPERVAEVFVKYKDRRKIIECVVEKIILPNARALIRIEGSKYAARDFISGETREKFQNSFFQGMKTTCWHEGIVINAARVTKCTPPDAICNPIQNREIAIRDRQKYEQEIKREIENIELQKMMASKILKEKETDALTKVSRAKIAAKGEKDAALEEMHKKLEFAQKRLQAAKDQASAILAKAKAQAEVIRLQNKANASGLEEASRAFGEGKYYANYLLLGKISASMYYVLANTDSPFLNVFKEMGKNLSFKKISKNKKVENRIPSKKKTDEKGEE